MSKKKVKKTNSKYRKCKVCNKNLPLIDKFWHKNKGSRDGFRSPCKNCFNKKNREKRSKNSEKYRKINAEWVKNNPEKVRESKKRDYKRHSDDYKIRSRKWRSNNLERDAENKARRYQEKKTEIKEYNRLYYLNLNNSEHIKRNVAKWIKRNPEKFRATQARRRDRKNELDCNITKEEIQIIYSVFNNKCFKCKKNDELAIDHHMPLSKGYGLTTTNAVILCKSCNSIKHNKHPSDFYSSEELKTLNKIFIIIEKKCRRKKCT